MQLTHDNYYTEEAGRAYMSCSQYQGFCECEAKQMAKLEGRWVDEPTDALIVGNYVHSWFEGEDAHEAFCKEYFDAIYKTKVDKKTGTTIITGKYAPYVTADQIIQTAMKDETTMNIKNAPGPVEQVMHGELFGIPWCIRIDKHIPSQHMIVDYKTSADIYKTAWNRERGESECFIESYGYMMRAAVYSEIYKQYENTAEDPLFVILAYSKQDYPAKGGYLLNNRDRYDYELDLIRQKIGHIARVKDHRQDARRCGRCDYCRATAGHITIKPYYVLKPGFEEGNAYDPTAQPVL